eukprot:s4001_g4.t1
MAVRYQLNLRTDFLAGIGPRCAHVSRSASLVASCFTDNWSQDDFDYAIQTLDVDKAWQLLSDSAEMSIFEDFTTGLSRAREWTPRKRLPRSKRVALTDSPRISQLRRLRRRIVQLGQTPNAARLRDKIARDLSNLVACFPDLSQIGYITAEQELHVVDQILLAQEKTDRDTALQRWRDSLEPSLHRQSSWVKREAEQQFAMNNAGDTPASAANLRQTAVHPVQFIKQPEQIWLQRWTCPAEMYDSEHLSSLQNFLNHNPALAAADVSVEWTGTALRRLCKQMATDAWSPASLLLLPDLWWDALATLWDTDEEAMLLAKARSDEFDRLFGFTKFTCPLAKCQLAFAPETEPGYRLAAQLGYKSGHCLQILGLQYDLVSSKISLLKFSLDKARVVFGTFLFNVLEVWLAKSSQLLAECQRLLRHSTRAAWSEACKTAARWETDTLWAVSRIADHNLSWEA